MSVNCSNHRHTWEVCSAAASELSLNVSEQFSHGPCAREHTHSFHCHLKCYWMNRFYFVRARPDTDTGAPARARPRNEFNFLLSNLVSSFYTMRGRTHTHTHTHARTHARRHALRHARQHARSHARSHTHTTHTHTHTHTHTLWQYSADRQNITNCNVTEMI